MEQIIEVSAAVPIATALVLIFKFALPSSSSKVIAAFAFLSGQAGAILIAMAGDGIHANQKVIAIIVISGITATVTAMGLRAGENSAEARRVGPEVQAARVEAAQAGAIQEKVVAAEEKAKS